MAGKIDALLKLSIVAAVLLASSSVAYYYAIYLPQRDARIEARTNAEKAAAEQRRLEDEQRRSEGAAAADQRRIVEKAGAQMRYNQCLRGAQDEYDATWNANCNSKRQKLAENYAYCMSHLKDQSYCSDLYKSTTASSNCTLPAYIADGLSTDLNKARDRCLQAYKSGL
jgi:hypothetical protein